MAPCGLHDRSVEAPGDSLSPTREGVTLTESPNFVDGFVVVVPSTRAPPPGPAPTRSRDSRSRGPSAAPPLRGRAEPRGCTSCSTAPWTASFPRSAALGGENRGDSTRQRACGRRDDAKRRGRRRRPLFNWRNAGKRSCGMLLLQTRAGGRQTSSPSGIRLQLRNNFGALAFFLRF